MSKLSNYLPILIVIALLTSCGGGGGSGGKSQNTSNAVMASPTIENGEKIEDIAANNQQDQYSLNAVSSQGSPSLIHSLPIVVKNLKKSLNTFPYSLNAVINETESCDYGGSLKTYGAYSETQGGSATLTYTNCDMGLGLMNGRARLEFSGYVSAYDDFRYYSTEFLNDFTYSFLDEQIVILAGSIYEQTNLSFDMYGPVEADVDLTVFVKLDGIIYGTEDVSIKMNFESYVYPEAYYTGGRFYIDNLSAYAEYDTSYDMSETPFVFNPSGDLTSGTALFNLAGGGKLKIVATGSDPMTYIDADGDGYFELSEQ